MNTRRMVCQSVTAVLGSAAGIVVYGAGGGFWTAMGSAILLSGMVGTVCAKFSETEKKVSQMALKKEKEFEKEEIDMLGMAEELAFSSQQLVWGVGHYRNVLKRLGKLSDEISRQSESNASNLEEATAGVEELASSSSTVARASVESLDQCKSSSEIACKHQRQMAEVGESMLDVTRIVQNAVKDIEALNVASGKITDFVGKIRGIASQTNLLALNAAIEAARAGENGRGFAVVAEEVRKLASESEQTTKEIEEIVSEITEKTSEVTRNMQVGNQELQKVELKAQSSADAMSGIVSGVQKIEETVQHLCSLSGDQRDTTEQMAKVVETIGHATVRIAGSTHDSLNSVNNQEKNIEEIFSHAKSMLLTSERMQEIAIQYKKDNEIIFGVNPFVAPHVIRDNYVPILNAAAEKIGYKARTIIVSDYDALGKAVTQRIVDIGWFSPFAYVSTKQKADLVPIVTPVVNRATSYTGYIITRKDSGINSIEDLAGKRFGFVDQKSASGYVYPKAALAEHGKIAERFFGETLFVGSHNKVIEEVLSSSIDAGATYSEAMDAAAAAGANTGQLRIIFKTDPIPKDVIAGAPGFDLELAGKFREAFESLKDSNPAYAFMGKAHINGFVATNDADYEVVRRASSLVK